VHCLKIADDVEGMSMIVALLLEIDEPELSSYIRRENICSLFGKTI